MAWNARKFVFACLISIAVGFAILSIFSDEASASRGTGARAPEVEPNNDFANATVVVFSDNNATMQGTLDENNDPDDYYNLTVPAGKGVTATLTITSPSNDFDLYIFNSSGGIVDYSASENSIETAAARSNGEYFYIYVTSYIGNGSYVLSLSIVTPPAPDGNDDMESATVVVKNQMLTSSLDQYFDKEDWFKINLEANETVCDILYVNMTNAPSTDYDLELVDLWGNDYSFEINSSMTEKPVERVQGVASYSGYYYVGVFWYSGTGNYNITFEVGEYPSDGDNVFTNASVRSLPCSLSGYVDQVYDRYDWYSFELTANETRIDSVTVNLTVQGTDYTVFSVMLLDSNLLNLDYSTTNETAEIFGSASVTGMYYVVVAAYGNYFSDGEYFIPLGGKASGAYQLRINMETEMLDGNDLPSNATQAFVGTTRATVGIPRDFVDWYYIDVRANSTVYVNLSLPANADFDLFIYGPEVAYDSVAPLDKSETIGLGGFERVECTTQSDVRLYICIRAFDEFGGGEYNMTIEVIWRNTPPVINASPKGNIYIPEEGRLELFANATDPDNASAALTYAWTVDGSNVVCTTNVYTYNANFSSSGAHVVRAFVTDPDGGVSYYQWNITVNQTNHAPFIVSSFPITVNFELDENGSVEFRINASDADIHEGDVLRYVWTVDEEVQDVDAQSKNFTYKTGFTSSGLHVISVTIKDKSNAFVKQTWNVTVRNVNRAPAIRMIEVSPPSEDMQYDESVGLAFTVHCSDPDNDELSIVWKEGESTLGQRSVLIQKFLPGHHTLIVTVSDGKLTAEQSVSFEITKASSPAGIVSNASAGLLIVTLVVIVLIVVVLVKALRRPSPPAKVQRPLQPHSAQAPQGEQAGPSSVEFAQAQRSQPICSQCGAGISSQEELFSCTCGAAYHVNCATIMSQCRACGTPFVSEEAGCEQPIELPRADRPISLRKK